MVQQNIEMYYPFQIFAIFVKHIKLWNQIIKRWKVIHSQPTSPSHAPLASNYVAKSLPFLSSKVVLSTASTT